MSTGRARRTTTMTIATMTAAAVDSADHVTRVAGRQHARAPLAVSAETVATVAPGETPVPINNRRRPGDRRTTRLKKAMSARRHRISVDRKLMTASRTRGATGRSRQETVGTMAPNTMWMTVPAIVDETSGRGVVMTTVARRRHRRAASTMTGVRICPFAVFFVEAVVCHVSRLVACCDDENITICQSHDNTVIS